MPKKKIFGLIARPDEIPVQVFHDHYRHPHGTMGLRISTLRDYVQCHQVHSEFLDESQSRYEAVAELWFDNETDILNFRSEATMAAYLNDDEWCFMDMKRSKHFIGEEEVLVSGPNESVTSDIADTEWRLSNRPLSLKLLQFIQPDADSNWCSDEDESLGIRLKAFRHVRCHPTKPASFTRGKKPRNPDFIGVRELWWPTLSAFNKAVAADKDAWTRLVVRENAHSMLAQAERFK